MVRSACVFACMDVCFLSDADLAQMHSVGFAFNSVCIADSINNSFKTRQYVWPTVFDVFASVYYFGHSMGVCKQERYSTVYCICT